MVPILLPLILFAAWSLVGLAVLVLLRADVANLRVALTAPVVGSAATVVALFLCSSAGVPMLYGGRIVGIAFLCGSLGVLAMRRPQLPLSGTPIVLACLGGAFLSGWPLFHLGFSWIANANSDMTLYVLSATRLLHHGLLSSVDPAVLSSDRDFAALGGQTYAFGGRPGTDITLAAVSSLTGRPPYAAYMTLGVALNMVTTSGVAALTMQATRRWWPPLLAAILYAVSPLATFGLVQQLVPQGWGLGLASVVLALLLRREMHQAPGPRMRDVALVGLAVAAMAIVYVELSSTVVVAYVLYVALLVGKRQFPVAAVALRLWLPVFAIVVITLNAYLLRDFSYVKLQVLHGTQGASDPPAFGYALVPSALAAVVGLQKWNAPSTSTAVGIWIVVAAVVLTAVVVGVVIAFRRGQAATIALAACCLLAVLLIVDVSDFGLFKLAMFVQPFLAATIAVLVSLLSRRLAIVVGALLCLLVGVQLRTQFQYVKDSQDPVDLRHASARALMPAFETFLHQSVRPVVSVSDNPVLASLEGSVAGSKSIYFISNNVFRARWRTRTFELDRRLGRRTTFQENPRASALLARSDCDLVLPTGSQNIFNRRTLPDGSRDLTFRDCKRVRNILVFTDSAHGSGFYTFGKVRDTTLYQLEPDYFYGGRTFSGIGRYLLFRLIRPDPGARLEVWLTTTVRRPEENTLPPAVAIGAKRAPIPIVGRGSARVFSAPLVPTMIGGQPYVMLDLRRTATRTPTKRGVIQGLFSRNVPLDARLLAAYARDISLVSGKDYRTLSAPTAVQRFPADLANGGLEYSGVYEDGWIADDSYFDLASGPAGTLTVEADVLRVPAQHLKVSVDRRVVFSGRVKPGALKIRMPIAASTARRKVELRWAHTIELSTLDRRRAAAHLRFVGIAAQPPSG